MRLHGVAWFDRFDRGPRLTFGDGTADGPQAQALPVRALENNLGRRATWSATVNPTGRSLEDLCTPPADPTIEATPSLNWCLRLRPDVVLGEGLYGIAGPLLLPDGAELSGAGGAILTSRTGPYGTTYQPAIPAETRTTLRVLDGAAFAFAKPDSTLTEIERVRRVLNQERTTTFLASGAKTATVRNLAFDGNATAEGLEAVDRALAESCLRNAPCHTALAFGRHGGLAVPEGRTVTLSGIYATDWAATAILGDQNAIFSGSTILLRNALYNHLLYAAEGTWDHLTLSGYAWTHGILAGQGRGGQDNEPSTYRNLVIHELAPNPSGRTGNDILDIRQGQGSVSIEGLYADMTGTDDGSSYAPFLAYANPYDRPGYVPGTPYVPPWDDPNYEGWTSIGDHVLTIQDATVTTESSRLITLRREGPVTLSDIRLSVPDSTAFNVVTPDSRAGQTTITGLRYLSDPVAPPVCDCTSETAPLEARIAILENDLATAQAANDLLRSALASCQAERDTLATAFLGCQSRAQEATRILSAGIGANGGQ
ncbi:MAG: hypothetical protein AAF170_17760 [Bacteroidota bacterium]